jgi:hypothetical protein
MFSEMEVMLGLLSLFVLHSFPFWMVFHAVIWALVVHIMGLTHFLTELHADTLVPITHRTRFAHLEVLLVITLIFLVKCRDFSHEIFNILSIFLKFCQKSLFGSIDLLVGLEFFPSDGVKFVQNLVHGVKTLLVVSLFHSIELNILFTSIFRIKLDF